MFTTLESDLGGSRIYGQSYDPIFDPIYARRQQRDEGFLDLMGGSQLDQHVVTFNLAWRPTKDWTIIPSFRYEHNNLDSFSEAIETNVASTGAAVTTAPVTAESQRDYDSVTESIEARYTGVKQWTFYAKGEWMQEDLTQIRARLRTGRRNTVPPHRARYRWRDSLTEICHRRELVSSVTGERRHPVLQEDLREPLRSSLRHHAEQSPAVTVIPLSCATTISTSMISTSA